MHARPSARGAALVMCVIILAVVLGLAVLISAQIGMLSMQANNSVQALQNNLLLQAAEEETRALLASDVDTRTTLHDARLTRTVQARSGATIGVYRITLQDTHAATGADRAVTRNLTGLDDDPGQQVWYWQDGQVRAPDPVNALTPAAVGRLAAVLNAEQAPGAAALVAALMDATDGDHVLSAVDGACGDEGLSLRAWPAEPSFSAAAFACRTTNASIHVGRLARGWSGWNSDVHFYPVAQRTAATRTLAKITLTKQYGRRTLERQHQTALNTLAPGLLNQFGVSNMWRGAVIKAVLAQNTCRANAEEWLLVEANYASGDDMTFECVPLFGDLFSTQFVANVAGDLCQYGWHGWTVTDDPLVPNDVKAETTPGLLSAPHTRIQPLEQTSPAKPYYICDAIVVRGLRRDRRYLVELVCDIRGQQNGTVDVLAHGTYTPVIVRGGRARLFAGVAQRSLPAAHANEAVLVIALRIPAQAAPFSVYGVELRAVADDAVANGNASPALCTWDNRSRTPLDLRAWSWAALDATQRTQWFGRIQNGHDGAVAFTHAARPFTLRQAFPLDEPPPGDNLVDCFLLDAGRAIRTSKPGMLDKDTQMQQLTVTVDGAPLLPGELCQRYVRLLPPDAYAADAPQRLLRCSPAFAVVTNDTHSVTVMLPRAARATLAWLAACTVLEPLDAPGGAAPRALLLDADQRCAALAQPRTPAMPRTPRTTVPNGPLNSTTALRNYLTGARAGTLDDIAWDICEALHCDYLPMTGTQLALDGILQAGLGTAVLTPRGLVNYAWDWQAGEFDNLYLRFPRLAVSNERFRITKTCAHCVEVDATGFPQRRRLTPMGVAASAATPAGTVELVTAAGAPIMVARQTGRGIVRIAVPTGLDGELAVSLRSETPAPCRATLSIFDATRAVWRSAGTNAGNATRWLTPAVPLIPGCTQILVRIDLLDVPQPHVRFFDLALVPAPRRMAALNLNTTSADSMVTQLHWPRARAAAMVAARPITALAALHTAAGMSDTELLAVLPHIVLRSDDWTATLLAKMPGARSARRIGVHRQTTPAATLHPVFVRTREPLP